MKQTSPLGPKALIASVLIAFAMVGTAMATTYSHLAITAPSQGSVINTNKPVIGWQETGSGGAPPVVRCGFDVPIWNTAPIGVPCPASETAWPTEIGGEGMHTFVLQYYPSGPSNVTTVVSTAFIVDTTPPVITITSPANGSTIVDETPTIAFGVTGSNTAQTAECSFDGAPFAACGPQFESPELAQGTHTLTVRAVDDYGNAAQASVTFTIDLSAPLENPLPPETANVTAGRSKVSGKSLKIATKTQNLPSPDVSPVVSCRGKVTVSIKPKVRRARTYKRRFSLKRSGKSCRASGTLTIPRKYKGRRATMRMRFAGNDYMGEIVVVKTIRL